MKNLFLKYKKVWMKPKMAGCNKYTAEYKVVGEPVKMKMRLMQPHLLKELNKQLDNMLKNGVISKAKSPWGGLPCLHLEAVS